MIKRMNEKLDRIAKGNGLEKALNKLAEECSEFAAAYLKYMAGEASWDKVLDEYADVMVMSRQVEMDMPVAVMDKVQEIMEFKIDRQLRRLQEWEKKS